MSGNEADVGDALANKLDIESSVELAREEELRSKIRAREIFDVGIPKNLKAGSTDALLWIHEHLFGDIYDFAGKIRSVNISKGHFRFASARYLAEALEKIEQMPQGTFDEIVEKYVEMNVAHPFREGNGRSMRIWLDHIFRTELGRVVDWSKIDRADYLLAMERSPVKDTEIKGLLCGALTTDIRNREIFMRGLDASYAYEGYDSFKAQDLEANRK